MRIRFHINQDSVAGSMFVIVGLSALYLGRNYAVGTSLRMGPGYMPNLLSWLLIIFGAGIFLKGAAIEGRALDVWHLRPLGLIVFGTLAFSFLIEKAGLPIAAIVTVLVGALGGREFRFKEVVILALGLAIACSGLFIYGLGLPMDIWPR
jgi:putative tricarboxylic transport membrane protein